MDKRSVIPAPDLPGKSLEEFFRQEFRHLPAGEQHVLIRRFGRFVHSLFEEGVQPRHLSLNQFRISGWQAAGTFHVADQKGFRRRRGALSDRQRFVCLRHLCSRMLTGTTRNQRFRFLQAVQGGRSRLRDLRALAIRLEKAALPLARRHWRRQARLSLGSNAWFVASNRGVWRTWSRRSEVAERLIDDLLPDPGVFLQQGQPMGGLGSGCTSGKIVVGGRPFFLKRYYQPGLRYKIKYLLRRSKAFANWFSSWQFHARELPVAQPLVLMERRRFGFLQESYLVYEFCEDGRQLMGLWIQLTPAEKRDVIIRSAQLLAKAHRCDCIHGDSNWFNILVCEGDKILLVDLDCAKIMSFFNYARAYRDLGHFTRDLRRRRHYEAEFLDLFISVWRRWLGPSIRVSREKHERVVRENPCRMFDDCV